MITITKQLIERDSDGALFIRYTPVYKSLTCLSTGALSFACFDAEVGESAEVHAKARENAKQSAIRSFRLLAEQLS